ncbi:hypothetical protein L3Q82_005669 [Scortum barcoo]|uniref:Uncharacterized protein n=1 Tax=Scortum barcoo TaxID=214431 RepID=A0ACB8V6F3_9TELE|nr:hypothetical protein L3Q82_005669 [Scortum barcoo]
MVGQRAEKRARRSLSVSGAAVCGFTCDSQDRHAEGLYKEHAVVNFLDEVVKVEWMVKAGIVLRYTFTPVYPLVNPSKKITVSNAPPFIKNDDLCKALSRRQVYMILKDADSHLNLTLNFKVDGFNYNVFVTSETMKCFGCGAEGHLTRACPEARRENGSSGRPAEDASSSGPATVVNEHGTGLISIDQEKAFDRVEHQYLWKTLAAFGFSPGFIARIQVLYHDVASILKINGGLAAPFTVQRGVRQGCSLSGMLYSLAIEPLLHKAKKGTVRLAVVDPPLICSHGSRLILVDFFWDRLHWLPQAVLFLPKEEGGQGLVHLASRCAAFRLQFIQRIWCGDLWLS